MTPSNNLRGLQAISYLHLPQLAKLWSIRPMFGQIVDLAINAPHSIKYSIVKLEAPAEALWPTPVNNYSGPTNY